MIHTGATCCFPHFTAVAAYTCFRLQLINWLQVWVQRFLTVPHLWIYLLNVDISTPTTNEEGKTNTACPLSLLGHSDNPTPNRHRLTEWVRFSLLHCFVLRVERTRLKLQTQQHETNNFMGQIWLLQREYWSKLFLSGSCHNGYRCVVQGRQRMHQHCTLFWSHALTARKDPGLAPGLGGQGQGHSNHLTRWQYGFGDPIAEYLSFDFKI